MLLTMQPKRRGHTTKGGSRLEERDTTGPGAMAPDEPTPTPGRCVVIERAVYGVNPEIFLWGLVLALVIGLQLGAVLQERGAA